MSTEHRFRQELDFYSKLLKPGSLCFDVGANIGNKTEVFLNLGATVVAFEPQPDCMRELEARCRSFQNQLHTCEAAVGEKAGEVVLYLKEELTTLASLLNDWHGTTKDSILVPMTTLDRAISEYGKPDYCKIDVEGYDFNVLKGLTHTIPLLSFEYHLDEREVQAVYDCLDYLSQFGQLKINMTPFTSMEFTFKEWISIEQFLAVFPNDFIDREGYLYGDIFVQTT